MSCTPSLHDRLLSATWRRIASAVLLLALGTVALHIIANPSRADEDDAESTINVPSRASIKDGLTVLTLNAAARENAGIETARPKPASALQTITAYGTVLDAGQQLTRLRNTYLSDETQVETAQAKLMVARAAFERAKTLNSTAQAVSLAVLQSAEGDFQVDQAALAAAQASLNMATATAEQTWGPVLGKALIDGAPVVENLIARRAYLVKVTLPAGTTVPQPPETVSATSGSGRDAQLQFISLGTSTDPKIQGVSFFYSVPAESGLLPGMTNVISLPGETIAGALIVPEAAVVWLQGKAWIYLRGSANTFVRREISPGTPASGGGYIVTNFPPDSRVVIRGAQMLLSEEFRAQVTTGADTD